MSNEMVKYESDNGQEITVSEQDVRDLISASGSNVNNVSSQEIKAFMRLCQAQRLNPFTKDAYLVKYGDKPATIIAGKETFTKRAQRNPRFRGYTAGITVKDTNGQIQRREGSMILPGECILGGWCAVYIEGYEKPMFDEVSFNEYNTGKSNWVKIPGTMIRKVAVCHALREAFPEDLGGLYGSEEMDQARDGKMPEQAPQQSPQAQINVESSVNDEPAPVSPWKRVGELKQEALDRGAVEEDMTGWMQANILSEDGSHKPMNVYTLDDISRVEAFLDSLINELEAHEGQRAADEAAEYELDDIDF